MKAIQHNNEETKTTNTQLRRITMNATKLTMIVFSAAAIFIGGCSKDNQITGPGNVENLEVPADFTTTVDAENNTARIAVRSDDQKIERKDFEATVKKSNVEGGCWYLENVEFARYTPYFEENAPKFYVGLKLHVSGYIDENMSSYCMIGPVFHIEKYKILSRDEHTPTADIMTETAEKAAARSAAADADKYAPASIDAKSQSALTVLKGYYGTNKEGCMYISDDKEIIAELHFNQQICPNIQNGTLIAVKGEYSLLTWSPCQLAPLFNVDKFQVLNGNDLVAKSGREGK